MAFIKLGNIISWFLLIGGALKLLLAIFVAINAQNSLANAAMSARYLNAENSGAAIDQAVLIIVAAVILGLLVHIAKKQ